MSKSPAALSGPLLFWRRQRPFPNSKTQQPTPAKDSRRNGRILFKLPFFRTTQLNKNEQHQ
jgi:hypothetical protein